MSDNLKLVLFDLKPRDRFRFGWACFVRIANAPINTVIEAASGRTVLIETEHGDLMDYEGHYSVTRMLDTMKE